MIDRRSGSVFRRVERWLVGLGMAALVFLLERLVIRQIERKQRAAIPPDPTAVTLRED